MTQNKIELFQSLLRDASDALDHAVQWIEDYAIPTLDPDGGGDVDGGNSLAAGLSLKSDEIRDAISGDDTHHYFIVHARMMFDDDDTTACYFAKSGDDAVEQFFNNHCDATDEETHKADLANLIVLGVWDCGVTEPTVTRTSPSQH